MFQQLRSRLPFSNDVTVRLTGVASVSAIGTLAVVLSIGLTGPSTTGSLGTLTPVSVAPTVFWPVPAQRIFVFGPGGDLQYWRRMGPTPSGITVALTGVLGTGSLGTVNPKTSVSLTGVMEIGSLGALSPSSPPIFFPLPLQRPFVFGPGKGLQYQNRYSDVLASPNVTLALTGVSSTGSLGSVASQRSVSLTGISGTGTLGSVSSQINVSLTGVVETGTLGTLTPSVAPIFFPPALQRPLVFGPGKGLQYQNRYPDVRTPSSNITLALTGVSASGTTGTLISNHVVALTAVMESGHVGSVIPGTTLSLLGLDTSGSLGTLTPIIGAVGWITQTGNRSSGTIYQNTGGSLMFVVVVVQNTVPGRISLTAYSDMTSPPTTRLLGKEEMITFNAGGMIYATTLFFAVPKNWYYEVVTTMGSISTWQEMNE